MTPHPQPICWDQYPNKKQMAQVKQDNFKVFTAITSARATTPRQSELRKRSNSLNKLKLLRETSGT